VYYLHDIILGFIPNENAYIIVQSSFAFNIGTNEVAFHLIAGRRTTLDLDTCILITANDITSLWYITSDDIISSPEPDTNTRVIIQSNLTCNIRSNIVALTWLPVVPLSWSVTPVLLFPLIMLRAPSVSPPTILFFAPNQ